MLEDLTMASNNFASNQTGQGSGITKPKKMSVIDLVTAQKDMAEKQKDNPGTLPYPLDTTVLDCLADSWLKLEDVISTIKMTTNSPLITSDEEKKKAVREMYKKIRYAQKIIKSCGDNLDDLLPNQKDL